MRLPLPCLVSARPPGKVGRSRRAFTLLEMLVVLIIIAIIAGLALPSIRGTSESAAINAACRQLVADLSYARQRAIAQRSTVAVVFISPDVLSIDLSGSWTTNELAEIKRLQGGVYTHYALYQYRKVGEQPGTRETGGYITEWKSLPEKTFMDPDEFDSSNRSFFKVFDVPKFRFPFSSSAPAQIGTFGLPYIAFDHEGRCIVIERAETGVGSVLGGDRELNVARGAILYSRITSGGVDNGSVDSASFEITQTPPDNATNNVIFIDALTGRTRRIETRLQ